MSGEVLWQLFQGTDLLTGTVLVPSLPLERMWIRPKRYSQETLVCELPTDQLNIGYSGDGLDRMVNGPR